MIPLWYKIILIPCCGELCQVKTKWRVFIIRFCVNGPLSKEVPASTISCANKKVMAVLKSSEAKSRVTERKWLELETMWWHMKQVLRLIISLPNSQVHHHLWMEESDYWYQWKGSRSQTHDGIARSKEGKTIVTRRDLFKKYIHTIHDAGGG